MKRSSSSSSSDPDLLLAQRDLQGAIASELKQTSASVIVLRILRHACLPSEVDVKKVMDMGMGMGHYEAMVALVVRQEIIHLRREGIDTLDAIREITNRVKNPVYSSSVIRKPGVSAALPRTALNQGSRESELVSGSSIVAGGETLLGQHHQIKNRSADSGVGSLSSMEQSNGGLRKKAKR